MKKYCSLVPALLLTAAAAIAQQPAWPSLKITPAQPKAGETIRFEYDPQAGGLARSGEIEAIAVEYTDGLPVALELQAQPGEGRIRGSFTPGAQALTALLVFRAGDKWDNNAGEGYFIALHDAAGQPLAEGPAAQAVLYRNYGGLYELNRKPAVTQALLERTFAAKPALKDKYFSAYVGNLVALKRDAGKTEGLTLLGDLERRVKTEKELNQIADLYERLGVPDRATALRQRVRTEFPKGLLVQKERREQLNYMTDLAARETAIATFQQDFPPQTAEEREALNYTYYNLAKKYADQGNYDKTRAIAAQIEPANRYQLYNGIAWTLAESNKDLQQARQFAQEATTWAENELYAPTAKRTSFTVSPAAWQRERAQNFAQWADTYAFVLDKLGDASAALPYQQRAVDITEGKEAEINERYTAYLERTGSPELRYRLEGFLLKGHATAAMKDQFKRLFAAEDHSPAGTEAYLNRLEAAARDHTRRELAAAMLDLPAPAFSLKNLKGETVSLESLRGKVVVVDFWATWCGPCRLSFPGMQKAVDQYKSDPNVAFVFIDCWERGKEKEKLAGDFIASKSYTFNVLMDTEDKVVSDFGVSGIPTKFVVDPTGKIRFKSVGYNGNPDALAEELGMMIELVKGAKP
jgi:thiol-disulfide isomerase/thioredoxin